MNETNTKIPALIFIYPEAFSDEKIKEDLEDIQANNFDLQILKRDSGAFASFEWIIPTAFGAYILKPYFDSFLSEAGKDHYTFLKKGLTKLIDKGKKYKLSLITSDQTPDKLSKTYSQSLVVSIDFQTIDGRHLRMLFDNNLAFSDWQNGLDQVLTLFEANYTSFPDDILTHELERLKIKQHRMVYVIINADTKELEFRDDSKMFEKYK
ncbi:MAG: hypothetical protein SFU21_07345 [Flavihumibacter sp.]|nr:hypothetical protein [Flavihumibacter sp.]